MQETYDIDDRHIGKSPQPRDAHYEPTTIILGLVALCLAFLAPTLFVLWRWRPSRQQGTFVDKPPPPFPQARGKRARGRAGDVRDSLCM